MIFKHQGVFVCVYANVHFRLCPTGKGAERKAAALLSSTVNYSNMFTYSFSHPQKV